MKIGISIEKYDACVNQHLDAIDNDIRFNLQINFAINSLYKRETNIQCRGGN